MATQAPSVDELASELGRAREPWDGIIAAAAERFTPLVQEWKPSKSGFGRMCLLKHRTRTLLYLTPEKETVIVAIVLGERAVEIALAGDLPEAIKALIRDARPYAEGRGIRFPVASAGEVSVVARLVAIKTAPR
ncbi:MAG TPA: DUF3788 family protein [Longimicrobium sp.]|nr:DUF3788 family protein [Longimicrobium sp.]